MYTIRWDIEVFDWFTHIDYNGAFYAHWLSK